MASQGQPITRDAYIDDRNKQDTLIGAELRKLRVHGEHLSALYDGLSRRVDTISNRLDTVADRLQENSAFVQQMDARHCNSRLRNPKLPIRVLPAYDPREGILTPNALYFPINADAFYALRYPNTPHKQKSLRYLVKFYDITLRTTAERDKANVSGTDDDSNRSDDDLLEEDSADIIDLLEGIFGLDETKFEKFRQRAQQYNSLPTRAKRSQVQADPESTQPRRRPQIQGRAVYPAGTSTGKQPSVASQPAMTWHIEPEAVEEGEEDNALLQWKQRSSPESHQRREAIWAGLEHANRRNVPWNSADGSATNPNTTQETNIREGEDIRAS